ncbi:telomere repeat-binding protein 4 [Ziziphus jujuba]|uniref:Telomere repeat-binding protein 4 n=1 Tax=Ziziphus jujuba TaxID=326968 RepID=A0ABM3IDM4_ZIZJJ|nr:telomere repeat-binding protein 4 [Ziziphus jujuba]
MVLKKRLEHGFSGFQVPTIPRAPRSARRRDPYKKKVDDSQICAFELLASLAGKLLQETESSSASSNASEGNNRSAFEKDVFKQGRQHKDKPVKKECVEPGSSEESVFANELTSGNIDQKFTMREFPPPESDGVLECTQNITKSDCSDKVNCDVKPVICNSSKRAFENNVNKVEGSFPHVEESYHSNVENGIERRKQGERLETGGLTLANTCSPNDPIELCVKFPAMISPDSNVKLSLFRDPVPNASFSRHRNDIKLGSRDDDENLSRCKKPSTKVKAYRPLARIGDRRIRKLLTSKYWKVAPKLRDCEVSRNDGGAKHLRYKRKTCYNHDRCHHDTLYKRRKLFDQRSVVTSDGGFSSESVSNSPEKAMNGDKSDSTGILHGATGVSSSVIGCQKSFHSKDSHVKFSIKSFRVPELYVDVPETATIGLLKRTVMEAVTAILQDGLHVEVLLQGKKIRDDNRTLLQSGISAKDNLDTLGFTLEPNIEETTPSMCSSDPLPSLSCDTPELLTRSPSTPIVDTGTCDDLPKPLPLPLTNSDTQVQSNHESVSSPTDTLTNEVIPDSQALVAVPDMSMEALAVIPVNQKPRRSELVQRRTRRPFSVSEVEALVQAVEELGTGRWRDVKLRAFEDADHRTYVDLKDKWKTLVHTAKISPQQRRGEPVPQELLDRVLAAHAYWAQHQAKQHGKHNQSGTLMITEAPADRQGVEGIPM